MTPAQPLELLVAAIPVVVTVLIVTLTAERTIPMLAGLALLAITPSVVAGSNLDWVQKVLILGVLILVLLRQGVTLRAAPLAAVVLFTAALILTVLPSGNLLKSPLDVAARAYLGYLLPWLFLLVRWRRDQARSLLRVASYLPVCAVPFGLALQILGVWPMIGLADGSPRLQGSSIPAHLALLAVVGVLAAAFELVLFKPAAHAAVWLVINLCLLVASLTRGGILASAIVFAALAVWTFTRGSRASMHARAIARYLPILLGLLLLAALPLVLQRSAGNAYEGAFNTSGREQAWPFYFGLGSASPIAGRGLGFASIAQALLRPVGVQQLSAPHNEYLHFFVDGGAILVAGMIVTVGIAIAASLRAVPRHARVLVWGMVPMLLVYSAVDNLFSTPQFSVPFVLVLSALQTRALRSPDTWGVDVDGSRLTRRALQAN